jgi:3-deoxy-manno-octulosonate cytidylyltransferase (CMP-KDO synthetase)
MVKCVYDNAADSGVFDEVLIVTCDQEIEEHGRGFGAEVVMTSSTHERASDRTAEAVQIWAANHGASPEVVCMLQGDEPMVTGQMLAECLSDFLKDDGAYVANIKGAISTRDDINDPNCIKVVCDSNGNALYMSRAPIPYQVGSQIESGFFKQVCAIFFRHDALQRFSRLSETPLERSESIDMLRFIENGLKVKMIPTSQLTYAVDTPHDLDRVQKLMRSRTN